MIRLLEPYLNFDDVSEEFSEVFQNGIFTRGKHVEAFSTEIADFVGAEHVFTTTSATTALWTCLKALGVGVGSEVVVSDFSFPASANVIEDLGAAPIFADVCISSFNMLPEELERKIGSRTKAVMFVDALGNPTGLDDIRDVCRRRGVPLIEDAACAIGSSINGRRCGSIADLTCFSFHPRKLINTGEGGAITTDNDEWAAWLRTKLAHGARGMQGVGVDFVEFGYNFRLSELQAIMGRKQLAALDRIIDERLRIRDAYESALTPLGFSPQFIGAGVRHNVQSLVFRVPDGWRRDELVAHLKSAGIESTLGTYSISATSYYRGRYANVQPNSLSLMEKTITLPCY